MTKQSEFVVSERNLFPMIESMLAEGKKVRFRVSGNSMWPFVVHNRDSVLLVSCDRTRLKKGDIILFETVGQHHILHRITKVKKGGYITTGDGNLHRDGFVPEDAVRAKVECIYRKGKKIDCGRWYWKIVFGLWMVAFPVRGGVRKAIRWGRLQFQRIRRS